MNATKPKQIDTIKAELLARKPVNTVMAFNQHCITRLAAIIERLRKRGWPVATTRPEHGQIVEYSLPEGWQPPDTKKP